MSERGTFTLLVSIFTLIFSDTYSALLDRITELEVLLSQATGANGNTPSSNAFSRSFRYPHPIYINGSTPPDYTSLAKVLDEDDTDDDPRKTSRFAGERLRRREEEEEESRLKRASKRPRVSKTTSSAPPPPGQTQAGAPPTHYGTYDPGIKEEQDFYHHHHQIPTHPGTGTIAFPSQSHG